MEVSLTHDTKFLHNLYKVIYYKFYLNTLITTNYYCVMSPIMLFCKYITFLKKGF